MYNIIKNPETNRNVSIYSKKGIAILEKYLNNLKGGIKLNLLKDTIPDDFRDRTYIELLNNIFKIIKDSKSNKNKNEVDLQILLKNIEDAPSSKISSVTIEYLYRNMLYFFISAQDKDNKFIENLYETDLQEKINLFKKNYITIFFFFELKLVFISVSIRDKLLIFSSRKSFSKSLF